MSQTFSQLGRIEALRQLYEGTPYRPFEDPLLFEAGQGDCIVSASALLLEGLDFNLVYFPLKHLGRKAVLRVTGELFAVMAEPRTLSVSLGVSAKLDFEQVKQIWSGIVAAAQEMRYAKVCLDLQPSNNGLVIALSASGSHAEAVSKSRPAAGSRDLICISGRVGAAFLGLRVLEKECESFGKGRQDREALEKNKMFVGAYLKPEMEPQLPSRLSESGITPSYGYFVTKGLADALLRLGRDSSMGVKVYADKIPFEGGSFALGKQLDIDPISAAMNGGEDFQLLYVVPISQYESFRKDFQTFDIIGHLALSEVGSVLVSPDGLEHPIHARGWETEQQ